MPASGGRNFGLDLARAGAISAVYLSHLWLHFVQFPQAAFLGWVFIGSTGVELFFALSGFLIGRLLIDLARRPGGGGVGRFLGRRWLRTLPLYYVALLTMEWLVGRFDWHPLLFLQNFYPDSQQILVVSWSLVMEEYFYLAFPLLVLGLYRATSRRLSGVALVATIAATIIVVCTAARVLVLHWHLPTIEAGFHNAPLLRLDACAYGVLAACLLAAWPAQSSFWRRPTVVAPVLALVAALLAGLLALFIASFHPQFLARADFPAWATAYFALLFSSQDAIYAVLVLVLAVNLPQARGVLAALAGGLSRISYSIYLWHAIILALWADAAFARFGWVGGGILLSAGVLAASALSWLVIERSFLRLRDRFVA